MPEGVIFDIDGTLVDSVDLHTEAWREAFRHFGFDLPFARVWEQIGKGSDQLIPAFASAVACWAISSRIARSSNRCVSSVVRP